MSLLSLSTRWKVLVGAFLAVYWAALALVVQYEFDAMFDVGSITPYLMGVGLAIAAGVLVGRWIVLLAAFAAPLVLAGLQLAGHRAAYHEASAPLSGWGWWLALCAVPLALGVFVRQRGLTPYPRPQKGIE